MKAEGQVGKKGNDVIVRINPLSVMKKKVYVLRNAVKMRV